MIDHIGSRIVRTLGVYRRRIELAAGVLRGRHHYLSTACFHEAADGDPDLHAACRARCKFCTARCACGRHPEADGAPATNPVDQARDIAHVLYGRLLDCSAISPELAARIAGDPDLFWLRGEVQPPDTLQPSEENDDR